ncbi:MAG: hypothetical protein P8Y62_10115 [candidate division WOR-3 bacterium]
MLFGCGGDKASSENVAADFLSSEFTPSNPRTTDNINIDPVLVEGENVELKWMVNGVVQDVVKPRLSPNYFSKGDTIECLIFVEGKQKKKIGPVVITNTKPEIIHVYIDPSEPRYGEELSILGDVRDPDDEDDVSFIVDWFINGQLGFSGEKLPGNKIKAGDEIYAIVEPFDGSETGSEVETDKVPVQNSPPEIGGGLPEWKERLMNYDLELKDPDGDNVELSLEESPPGMRLEGTTLIWQSPEVERDTSFNVTVKAREERGGETSLSFSLDIKKREVE